MTLHPLEVLVLALIAQWLAARMGAWLRTRRRPSDDGALEDFNVILAATLTLLGLVIGFTFSMAINRYDQRKNLEEAEANAIGTEWLRADVLAAKDAESVRAKLKRLLDQRILVYATRDTNELQQMGIETARMEGELWSSVVVSATANPTPIVALAVSGMNDVINARGYTDAAWLNRVPGAAWALMAAIALCSNALLGFGSRSPRAGARRFFLLPLVISIAFMLIADIDAPRRGLIEVKPANLKNLAALLDAR